MLRFLTGLAFASSLLTLPVPAAEPKAEASKHALFVWAGDRDKQGNDFLLVIDADPRSPNFGLDVRNPLQPSVVTSFNEMGGYAHPHSYLRLPNGNVLASFQHDHATMHSESRGKSGGLVEINDKGELVRAVSTADPAFPDALLMPYSLAVLPDIDRVVSTNSSMHDDDLLSGTTYKTGALSVDEDFRDTDGKTGFSFADRDWPHGWKGTGLPHGAVFSR